MSSSPQYEGQLKGPVTKVEAWASQNVQGPRGDGDRTDHTQRSMTLVRSGEPHTLPWVTSVGP